MEVTGKITKVLPIEKGQKKDGSGEWQKLQFVLDNNAQYNNIFCFEVFGDEKVENFNKYNKVGDVVKVDFNVSTNEWKGRYFTSLQAWKIFKADATQTQEPVAEYQAQQVSQAAQDLNGGQDDSLPF